MAGTTRLPKVCIIGAGCSGFTAAKRLKDYGAPFDLFEASDNIGGISLPAAPRQLEQV